MGPQKPAAEMSGTAQRVMFFYPLFFPPLSHCVISLFIFQVHAFITGPSLSLTLQKVFWTLSSYLWFC